jgi:hypothetical protein
MAGVMAFSLFFRMGYGLCGYIKRLLLLLLYYLLKYVCVNISEDELGNLLFGQEQGNQNSACSPQFLSAPLPGIKLIVHLQDVSLAIGPKVFLITFKVIDVIY